MEIKIVEEKRNQPRHSEWHDCITDYTDTYLIVDGVKRPVTGIADVSSDAEKQWHKERMEFLRKQAIENGGKWITLHCGSGCLGNHDKFVNPFTFLEWVRKNKYSFEAFSEIVYSKQINEWLFWGNLKEYSCCFKFRVWDKDTATKIRKELSALMKSKK